jgi:hypothetical protein
MAQKVAQQKPKPKKVEFVSKEMFDGLMVTAINEQLNEQINIAMKESGIQTKIKNAIAKKFSDKFVDDLIQKQVEHAIDYFIDGCEDDVEAILMKHVKANKKAYDEKLKETFMIAIDKKETKEKVIDAISDYFEDLGEVCVFQNLMQDLFKSHNVSIKINEKIKK